MPYSADHKQQSYDRIRQAAADLFCRYGFDQVSISQVMKKANMTHGAFYAHFSSKGELYDQAIKMAAKHSLLSTESRPLTKDKLIRLLKKYLSLAHVKQEVPPCPLAFLSTDIAHPEEKVKRSYEAVFNGMVQQISQVLTQGADKAQSATSLAQQLVVSMVGTVSIARSITDIKAQTSLLENAQKGLIQLLNDH